MPQSLEDRGEDLVKSLVVSSAFGKLPTGTGSYRSQTVNSLDIYSYDKRSGAAFVFAVDAVRCRRNQLKPRSGTGQE